ncbi:putative acetyltransferase [Alteromonadaceae bacterium Bs31]|nr:putative acetyltransferase [Alteromonadaceae bacterium Bs31]
MNNDIQIIHGGEQQLGHIVSVEQAAFETNEEAELTKNLLADPSATPILSLLAYKQDTPVGHVLFTHAELEGEHGLQISLLAPLAVVPAYQKQGCGSALVHRGLHLLEEQGIDIVFVLGDPRYYTRFGFEPAYRFGLSAPYHIADKHRDAWMLKSLRRGISGNFDSKVICAKSLYRAEYWCE